MPDPGGERSSRPRSVDDLVTPEEKQRFLEWKRELYRDRGQEMPFGVKAHVAAFMGIIYGWQAVRDFLNGDIEYSTALQLYKAGKYELEKQHAEKAAYTQSVIAASFSKDNARALQKYLNARLQGVVGEEQASE